MPEEQTFTHNSELSPKQEMLIAALLAGNTMVVSAKAAGVTDKTARLWMKQPHFQEAYRSAKQAVFDENLEALRDGVETAITTIRTIMTDSSIDPAVRLRAATAWLQQSIQVYKNDDLEARIIELEEALKATRV
jgi:hypothetical protein